MLRLEDVSHGDVVIADGGFGCLTGGAHRTVHRDDDGHLYICCAEGRHYLNGQISGPDGNLAGLAAVNG